MGVNIKRHPGAYMWHRSLREAKASSYAKGVDSFTVYDKKGKRPVTTYTRNPTGEDYLYMKKKRGM